tara:strand:+ start:939 stop:1313 length:375 start_codon:yes stop_codon:yes gene_type:complete
MDSLSKIKIIITTSSNKLEGELLKHLSPMIVNQFIQQKILTGPLIKYGDSIVYAPIGIKAGFEKPKSEFKKGDIAFFPTNNSICIFLKDIEIKNRMTLIGKIINGLESLYNISAGEVIKIEICE